jgi:deazaflavin-dependent oxidoreductase (nitroreductase family)
MFATRDWGDMSLFMKIVGNPFMKTILRSPLYPLMGKNVAVISVTGKRSGKVYSLPVNFQRDGEDVWIVSRRNRTWWKNLRGGAKVTLRLSGRDLKANGEVFEDHRKITHYLGMFILRSPAYGKFFDVGFDAEGNPIQEDLESAAESRVIIRVVL